MDPFIGQLLLVPYTFAPRGWIFAQGQILAISQNTALFSLLGTNYGGDGKSNFGLPDLRGQVAIGYGQGPGLSDYSIGENGGFTNVTLNSQEIPRHNHIAQGVSQRADQSSPNPYAFADAVNSSNAAIDIYTASSPASAMNTSAIAMTGSNLPHNNMMPFLTLNWCICLQGVFPSRS